MIHSGREVALLQMTTHVQVGTQGKKLLNSSGPENWREVTERVIFELCLQDEREFDS